MCGNTSTSLGFNALPQASCLPTSPAHINMLKSLSNSCHVTNTPSPVSQPDCLLMAANVLCGTKVKVTPWCSHERWTRCPTEVEKDECRCDTSNANGFMRWQASFQLKSLEEKPSRPSPKPATQVKLQTKKWDKLGGPKTIAQGNGYRCWRHYLILTTHVTLFCFLKGGRRVLGSFFPFAICFFLTKII